MAVPLARWLWLLYRFVDQQHSEWERIHRSSLAMKRCQSGSVERGPVRLGVDLRNALSAATKSLKTAGIRDFASLHHAYSQINRFRSFYTGVTYNRKARYCDLLGCKQVSSASSATRSSRWLWTVPRVGPSFGSQPALSDRHHPKGPSKDRRRSRGRAIIYDHHMTPSSTPGRRSQRYDRLMRSAPASGKLTAHRLERSMGFGAQCGSVPSAGCSSIAIWCEADPIAIGHTEPATQRPLSHMCLSEKAGPSRMAVRERLDMDLSRQAFSRFTDREPDQVKEGLFGSQQAFEPRRQRTSSASAWKPYGGARMIRNALACPTDPLKRQARSHPL